jgi:hypothetical protein
MRLGDNAPRGTEGQSRNQLLTALKESQCWLEFSVRRTE